MLKSLLVSAGMLLGSILFLKGMVPEMTQAIFAVEPQGVQGMVLCWSGNRMPGGGSQSRAVGQPVKTTVWIFEGRIAGVGSPRWAVREAVGRELMKKASNAAGEFSVQLPAGEYTLFAQYGDDLYLNSFLADGSFATVRVEPGQWVDLRLENTEEAFF